MSEDGICFAHRRIHASVNFSMAIGDDGDVYLWGKSTQFDQQAKSLPTKMKLTDQHLFYKAVHVSSGLSHATAILQCQLSRLAPAIEIRGAIAAVVAEHTKILRLNGPNGCDEVINYFKQKRYVTLVEFRQFYMKGKMLSKIQYSREQRELTEQTVGPNQFEKQFMVGKHPNNEQIDIFLYYQQLTIEFRPPRIALIWGSTAKGRLGLDYTTYLQSKQKPKHAQAYSSIELTSRVFQSETRVMDLDRVVPDNEILGVCRLQIAFGKISCGHHHTIGITDKGQLYVWGMGGQGCLGTGRIDDIKTPKELKLHRPVIDIAAGAFHCLALTQNHKVYGWGVNIRGQLGIGNKESQLLPQELTYFKDKGIVPMTIYAGDQHSATITDKQELYSWGNGDYYRLGHGMLIDELVPKKIEVLQDVYVTDVALGTIHSLCITNEGFVYSWGSSKDGVLGIISEQYKDQQLPQRAGINSQSFKDATFYQVAAGLSSSIGLSNKGALYTWGTCKQGLLGIKTYGITSTSVPQKVLQYQDLELNEINKIKFYSVQSESKQQQQGPILNKVSNADMSIIKQAQKPNITGSHQCTYKFAVCGSKNTFFIDTTGHLMACGSNENGLLCKNPGNKQIYSQFIPKEAVHINHDIAFTPIETVFFKKTLINFISCSYNHAIVITNKGNAYSWGNNKSNQLGLGFSSDYVFEPIRLQGSLEQKKIVMSCCGDRFSAIITESGELWTFGTSENGVLGQEDKNYYVILEPRMVNDIDPIVYITCSKETMMAINDQQQLYVWGNNQYGQLGVSLQREDNGNTEVDKKQPEMAGLIANLRNLKNPDYTIVYQPVKLQIRGPTGDALVSQVACGLYHSILITTTNDLLSCGLLKNAGHSVLMEGDDERNNRPEYIDQFSQINQFAGKKFISVATHELHTMALTTTNQLYGWGINAKGVLGSGCKMDENQFTNQIKIHLTDVEFLACGIHTSLIIQKSGIVSTWGSTLSGKLGVRYNHVYDASAKFVESIFKPITLQCYQCENAIEAVNEEPKQTKSENVQKSGKSSKSKSKQYSKGKSKQLDQSLEEELILDELSFRSEEEDGHIQQDPLQKELMKSSNDYEAESLCLQDAEIEKKFQVFLLGMLSQAASLSVQLGNSRNSMNQTIDYRSKQLVKLSNSKPMSSLRFQVPQFIVKNIQLYELIFSTMYYHPCYILNIMKYNRVNKFQIVKWIQILYKNELSTYQNKSAIMSLAIRSFAIEFKECPSQQDYINELKIFKNSSVFYQIYLLFIEQDKTSSEFFKKEAFQILNNCFFKFAIDALKEQFEQHKIPTARMNNYFNFHQGANEDTHIQYKVLTNVLQYYLFVINTIKDKCVMMGEEFISQESKYLHGQIVDTIKQSILQRELDKLTTQFSKHQQHHISIRLQKLQVRLDEKIKTFMMHLYFSSITHFIIGCQEQSQKFQPEYQPFFKNSANIKVIAQIIDRYFQTDPMQVNHQNVDLVGLIKDKSLGKHQYGQLSQIAVQLFTLTQFRVENANMQELIIQCYQTKDQYLQIEVQDILLLQQFYNEQLMLDGEQALKQLFIREKLDPIFIALRHMEFKPILIDTFSTEILNRKINLKLMVHPLMQLVNKENHDKQQIHKCHDCEIMLSDDYIGLRQLKYYQFALQRGWKCRNGHHNQLKELDCTEFGCKELILQTTLKSTRLIHYYCNQVDYNIVILNTLLTELFKIPKGQDMFALLTQLQHKRPRNCSQKLMTSVQTMYHKLNKQRDQDIKTNQHAELTEKEIKDQFNDNYQTIYQKSQIELKQRKQHRYLQMLYLDLFKQLETINFEQNITMRKLIKEIKAEEEMLSFNRKIYSIIELPNQSMRTSCQAFGYNTSVSLFKEGIVLRVTFQNKIVPKLVKNLKFYFYGQSDGGWIIQLVYLQDDMLNLLVPCFKNIYPIEMAVVKFHIGIEQYLELRRMAKYQTQITMKSETTEVTFGTMQLIEKLKQLEQRLY